MLESAVQPISLTKGISFGRTVFIAPVQFEITADFIPRHIEAYNCLETHFVGVSLNWFGASG